MHRTKDIVFIACFLAVICVPQFIKTFNISVDETNSEKRDIKPAPVFNLVNAKASSGPWNVFQGINRDLETYKGAYDEYYTENFKLKNNLFDLYVKVKRDILHSNPIPLNVMEGRDGWFFLGNSYCDVMLEYTALKQFNRYEVDSVQRHLTDMATYLKARNIGFYVVVAPDKQNTYGEYLPLQRKAGRATMLEQMKAANKSNAYNLLDLSEALNRQRDIRLFHKTDTHWNDYGAFVGFEALINRLQQDYPDLESLPIADFRIDTVNTYQRDLTEMLRIKEKEGEIRLTYLKPAHGVLQRSRLKVPENTTRAPGNYEARFVNGKKKLKVLVFRDSFSDAWKQYFKECFGETVFIGGYEIDRALIELEAPDIVIYEKVQRDIDIFVSAAI